MIDNRYAPCIISGTEVSDSRATYGFTDFIEACREAITGNPSRVGFERWVRKEAMEDFNLKTAKEILVFIVADGLENLEFINTAPYKISPEIPPPMCDAYAFSSGFTEGYISFFFSQASQKWIIKSFHRTSDCGETVFTLAFKKAGLLTGFEE